MTESYRKESRKDWIGSSSLPTEHQINTGSLQRIADATELMAKRHTDLIRERDDAAAARDRAFERENVLARRVTALKGVITKLQRKAEQNMALMGAAYQVVGAADGPVEMLDNLVAASSGKALPNDPSAGLPWSPAGSKEPGL